MENDLVQMIELEKARLMETMKDETTENWMG